MLLGTLELTCVSVKANSSESFRPVISRSDLASGEGYIFQSFRLKYGVNGGVWRIMWCGQSRIVWQT